ncbi:F-box protein SKP2A [Camellia lanceoleosa]|nr:F-box protein SKP2A [Camellia lanceoleosa]
MVGRGLMPQDLDLCFQKLMVFGAGLGGIGGAKMGCGGVITEWKDIPMELLLRIVSLGDDQTVIVAAGVWSGWRMLLPWDLPNSPSHGARTT